MDAWGDANRDVGAIDANSDGGRGMAGTCEACNVDRDCVPGAYCAALGRGVAGRGCLPACIVDLPSCPPRFSCVAGFPGTMVSSPVCAPVGDRCCVDFDNDGYGSGVGCMGPDCNDMNPNVHPGAPEICNGIDDNCNGMIDEGDPAVLCPHGPHVSVTACTMGACTLTMCEVGYADCNRMLSDGCERSINTPTDCGACGVACMLPHSTSPVCNMGMCAVGVCDPGYGNCDMNPMNGCEQMLNTATHCGGCGVGCNAPNSTTTCATGMCAIATCDRNWGDCDGRISNGCESPLTTNINCGVCNTICAPVSGAGDCSTGTCRITTCASGFANCSGNPATGCETNIRTLTNCGACGAVCSFPNASASCPAGACSLGTCNPGYGNCDGITANGCETMTNTATHCGGCGIPCAPARATASCSSGMCAILSCAAGYADCNGITSDGCETSTRTLTDCGSCGTACTRAGAIADCSIGMCRIGACLAGYSDCDGIDSNGCEVSIRTLTNCGGCAITCARANATATCGTGTCTVGMCNPGYGNCDGLDANGCEVSLSTPSNCGTCGSVCTRANATTSCPSGVCTLGTCNPGYADCNGLAADGCETSVTTTTNCGTCGNVCNLAHASAQCTAGACAILSCAAGWGDCDLNPANGCEADLRTLANCGTCGSVCLFANAAASCGTGICTMGSCNPGFGNCNGLTSDGCEAPLNTLTNCGICGAACALANASATCATMSCAIMSCNPGWGNCDGLTSNGCEAPLNTLTNCAGCGVACTRANATATCASGACAIMSCSPGYANCAPNPPSGGCETPITTLTNCGGCGVACAPPRATGMCSGAGVCSIAACAASYFDVNGLVGDGCECMDDSSSNSCNTATPIGPGTINPTQTLTSGVGKIPLPGMVDWYTIQLPAPGTGRPHVDFTVNDGGAFVFDIFTSCSGAAGGTAGTCAGAGETSSGLTSWDFNDNCVAPSCATRSVPWPAQIWIRVRRTTVGNACTNYQLHVTR